MKKFMILVTVLMSSAGSGVLSAQQIQMLRGDSGGYLGVELRDITRSEVEPLGLPGERGVFVVRVGNESPAQKAGLGEGDVILEFAGFPVFSVRQFQRLVGETPPGRQIQLVLMRRSQRIDSQVTVEERPMDRTLPFPPTFEYRVPGPPGLRGFRFEERPETFARPLADRPRLGIHAQPITSQLAENLGVSSGHGVLIVEVLEGGSAQKAGLMAGDVITSVGGKEVEDVEDLVSSLDSGDVTLEIIRNRQKETVTVRLEGDAPAGEGKALRL